VATVAVAAPPAGRARLALVAACVAFGVVTALAITPRGTPPTTYGAASAAAAIIGLAAGFALLAIGAATSVVRPRGCISVVTASLGLAWVANDWVGWEGGPAIGRSIAMGAVPFLVPLVAHLTLAYPSGRVDRVWWLPLGAIYTAAVVTSVGHALFRDPFLDLGCWSNCSDNSFLVRADADVVRFLDDLWLTAVIGAAIITLAAAVTRLTRATSVARRSMTFVLTSASVVAAGNAVHAWLVDGRTEDPTAASFRAVFFLRAGALLAVAVGVGLGLWRGERTKRSVMRLVHDLGATPTAGSLGPVLSRTLGDRDLTVAYWLPSSQRYVDASGHQVEPRAGPGQTSTSIVRNGEPVAVVIHDAALSPQDEIGPAARLAVDNERLHAEVLARLADLRASRARIVATADRARRQLERDLHDGAQQRLLAASFELRQACTTATARGDAALAAELNRATEQTQQALTELRDLAHGIYPAILTEAGLEPAVRSLADRAPLPVEVLDVVGDRYPPAVESTAYAVVAQSLDDAVSHSAASLTFSVVQDDDRLLVLVKTERTSPSTQLVVDLADRVGALGGTVEVSGGKLTAEIPCGS
jgi:signal transduction histidine kinase